MAFGVFADYKKRGIRFGLPFVLFVGVSVFLSFETDAFSGCAGDCMTCHPKLEKDEDHISLKTCITCHDPAKPKLKIFSGSAGCGDRCFVCHSEWPQNGAHAALDTCLKCHEK